MKALWKKYGEILVKIYATLFIFAVIFLVIFLFVILFYPESAFVETVLSVCAWTFAPAIVYVLGLAFYNLFKFIKEDIWGM